MNFSTLFLINILAKVALSAADARNVLACPCYILYPRPLSTLPPVYFNYFFPQLEIWLFSPKTLFLGKISYFRVKYHISGLIKKKYIVYLYATHSRESIGEVGFTKEWVHRARIFIFMHNYNKICGYHGYHSKVVQYTFVKHGEIFS